MDIVVLLPTKIYLDVVADTEKIHLQNFPSLHVTNKSLYPKKLQNSFTFANILAKIHKNKIWWDLIW